MNTNEITKAAKEYREYMAMIKELQDEADAIKANLIGYMDEKGVEAVQADVFTVKWTKYQSQRIDTTAFKKEMPDVAARYTKTTETRRFMVA